MPAPSLPDPVRWAFSTGVRLLGAGKASLLLRGTNSTTMTVVASIGLDEQIARQVHVRVGEGVAGIVADRGVHMFGARGETTFISLPVITQRGVEGVINLTDHQGEGQFSDEHIPLAKAVAAHVAALLDYSRHEQAQQDPGIPDRQTFLATIERELARSKRVGCPFVVAVLSVEVLQWGDNRNELVAQLGNAVHAVLRRYDYAAYLGRMEFGIIIAIPYTAGSDLPARFKEAVSAAARAVHADIRSGVGIAQCPEDAIDATGLLTIARRRSTENRVS